MRVPRELMPQDHGTVYVGVSGGPDSMALLHFLSNFGKRRCVVLNFNHGTEFGQLAHDFLESYCSKYENMVFNSAHYPSTAKPSEANWRDARYKFFVDHSDIGTDIYLGHNLDDSRENYLMTFFSSRHPAVIPPRITKREGAEVRTYIRPLSFTKRADIYSYLLRNGVPFLEDPTNSEDNCTRTKMRNIILPLADSILPGDGGYALCKRELWNSIGREGA